MALRPCGNDFGKASLKRAKGRPGRATMMSKAETTNFCESVKLKFEGHGERCPAFIVVLSRARALWQRMFHGCSKGRGEVMKVLTQSRGSEWWRDVRESREGCVKEFLCSSRLIGSGEKRGMYIEVGERNLGRLQGEPSEKESIRGMWSLIVDHGPAEQEARLRADGGWATSGAGAKKRIWSIQEVTPPVPSRRVKTGAVMREERA